MDFDVAHTPAEERDSKSTNTIAKPNSHWKRHSVTLLKAGIDLLLIHCAIFACSGVNLGD